jgi:late competence protein required for DNA uptake (superfamily II DNA/RNA helicase)
MSWDIIKAVDLWEDGDPDDGYVLVKQEDVVDGITSFMAAYLLSLEKTKVTISCICCGTRSYNLSHEWCLMRSVMLCRTCLLINFRKVSSSFLNICE